MGTSPCTCICFKKSAPPEATPVKIPQNVIVGSKYSLADVERVESTPQDELKKSTMFNCPVCLCYHSTILVGECCGHYICHYCISEMQLKQNEFDVSCPHCRTVPYKVTDVDHGVDIKKYFDSQSGWNSNSKNRVPQ